MLHRAVTFMGCVAGLMALALASVTWADAIEQWTPRYSIIKCQFGSNIDGANTQVQSWSYSALSTNGGSRTVESITGIKRGKTTAHVTPTTYLGPYSAVKMSAGDPEFILSFGNLSVGCYAVRVIAAIKTIDLVKNTTDSNYPDNFFTVRKPMYIDFYVNDKVDGSESYYRQRIPVWDSFYCVTELYFMVDVQPGTRAYTGRLKVGNGSLAPLYIRSIELHNVLAGLPGTTVKTGPSSFTLAERAQLRTLKTMAQVRSDVSAQVAIDDGYLNTDVAPYAEGSAARNTRDDLLWNALLPLNKQYIQEYDESFAATSNQRAIKPNTTTLLSNSEVASQYGTWDFPYYWTRGWYSGFKLRNSQATSLIYTRSDLEQHRALNQVYTSFPYADTGTLLFFPYDPAVKDTSGNSMTGPAFWSELAYRLGLYWESVQTTLACYHGDNHYHHLAWLYHAGPDATQRDKAARDAAFLLARFAYAYPAISDAQALGHVVVTPNPGVGLDERLLYRYFLYQRGYNMMQGLLWSYDYLFDYIDDPVKGQALATALNRYIPWITTKEDVKRMIETRLVQFAARNIRLFQLMNDSQSPEFLALVAMIQQSNNAAATNVTAPWMSQLWSKEWIYGYAMAGTPDYVSTTVQRDGSTTIASVFYTQGGSPLATTADHTSRYIAAGGDSRYNLTDLGKYRKIQDSNLFPLDSTIAGAYPMTIGDVGSPDKARMLNILSSFDGNFRRAWRWGQDPRAAWILKNYLGRLTEDDASWDAITAAATSYGRNPFLALGSRVMADWAGILESGQSSDDYRFKRTAYMRVGYGSGHSHSDTLDLQVQAHGVRLVNDLGYRSSYGYPGPANTMMHNRVAVGNTLAAKTDPENANWNGPSWVGTFKSLDGAQYQFATAYPQFSTVYAFNRAVALIDVDEGSPAGGLPSSGVYSGGSTASPTGVTTPNSYVFDVQRVNGGIWPTFCFHGNYSDDFATNMTGLAEIAYGQGGGTDEQYYMRKFMDNADANGTHVLGDVGSGYKADGINSSIKYGGTPSVNPLVATWRLRRATGVVNGYDRMTRALISPSQSNAEQTMLAADYSASNPRKYTRLYLFDRAADRGLVGYYTPDMTVSAPATWPFLEIQNRNEDPNNAAAKQVYMAIIEPFAQAGSNSAASATGFITSASSLAITNNGSDHLKAVAARVTTSNGRTDLNFSDGVATTSRGVAGGNITGKFAYVSKDGPADNPVRLAHLVEGSQIALPDPVVYIATTGAVTAYTTTVTKVDYYNRKLWVSRAAFPDPSMLVGEQIEISNAYGRNTSYPVVAAALDVQGAQASTCLLGTPQGTTEPIVPGAALGAMQPVVMEIPEATAQPVALAEATETILTVDKALDVSYAEVNNVVSGSPSKIHVRLLPLIDWTGARGGWTLTNDDMSKSWKVTYTGTGSDSGGTYYIYQVNSGGSVSLSDFPLDSDGRRIARVWQVGVGDTLKVPVHVYLKRDDSQSDATQTVWKLKANVGLTVGTRSAATNYSYRWDGQPNWQSLTTSPNGSYQVTTLSAANLVNGAGTLYLRAQSSVPLTITASAGAGGTITPLGVVSVPFGANQGFTIAPNTGYNVSNVLVDGVSVGAVTSYTFNNVIANHTIAASFSPIPLTVTINQASGQTDPTGDSPVNFTVVFSAPVSDFTSADVTLTGTAGAATATVTQAGSMDGTTYNAAVSGMTQGGTVIASLLPDVAHGPAGNGNLASTSSDNTVTYNKPVIWVLGDLNNDGIVNNQDIAPFVLALTDPAAWQAAYPGVNILGVGDINGDQLFNNQDIALFVDLLTSGNSMSLSLLNSGTTQNAPTSTATILPSTGILDFGAGKSSVSRKKPVTHELAPLNAKTSSKQKTLSISISVSDLLEEINQADK